MYKDKWAHTESMGPKSILRTMKILGPSPASLAQFSWSLLSNVLGGRIASCILPEPHMEDLSGLRIEMQHLMYLLERDMYIHWHVANDEEVARDIFWAHLDVVKLLNAFNILFFMDSTYKTNIYRLPLLEIVGVTCTALTFSVVFAYMEVEREKTLCGHLKGSKAFFADKMNCLK